MGKNLDWNDLNFFLDVAVTLSIRHAASKLNTSPATLSRRILNLEENLGHELFIRKPHGLEITSFGEMLVEKSKQVALVMSEITEIDLYDSAQECIHIGCPPCYANIFVIPALRISHHERPFYKIILNTSTDLNQKRASVFDISISCSRPQFGNYIISRLPDYSLSICAARTFDLTGEPLVPLVVWGEFDGTPSRWNEPLFSCFPQHRIAFVANDFDSYFNIVKEGHGVGLLPKCLVASSADQVRCVSAVPPREIWLSVREEIHRLESTRHFISLLKSQRQRSTRPELVLAV